MLKRQVKEGGSVGDGGGDSDGELKIEVGEGRSMGNGRTAKMRHRW